MRQHYQEVSFPWIDVLSIGVMSYPWLFTTHGGDATDWATVPSTPFASLSQTHHHWLTASQSPRKISVLSPIQLQRAPVRHRGLERLLSLRSSLALPRPLASCSAKFSSSHSCRIVACLSQYVPLPSCLLHSCSFDMQLPSFVLPRLHGSDQRIPTPKADICVNLSIIQSPSCVDPPLQGICRIPLPMSRVTADLDYELFSRAGRLRYLLVR